jgi:homospermidine synthase
MAKTSSKATAPALANALFDVFEAGYQSVSWKDKAMQAIKAAGGEKQKAVRTNFIAGAMCRIAMGANADFVPCTAEMQAEMLAALTIPKGSKRKISAKTAKLYDAGRQVWSRLLKKAGVKSVEKRGTKSGASKVAAKAAIKAAASPAPIVEGATPTAKTWNDQREFYMQERAKLLGYSNKNAKTARGNAGEIIREVCRLLESLPASDK